MPIRPCRAAAVHIYCEFYAAIIRIGGSSAMLCRSNTYFMRCEYGDYADLIRTAPAGLRDAATVHILCGFNTAVIRIGSILPALRRNNTHFMRFLCGDYTNLIRIKKPVVLKTHDQICKSPTLRCRKRGGTQLSKGIR